jgi:hypothetical protein
VSVSPPSPARGQNLAASLVVRNDFVSWVTSFSVGSVARCPLAGCPGDRPEILADHQYFPRFVEVVADTMFWMNGCGAPGHPHALQITSCQAASCPSTFEVLDEGTGCSIGALRWPPVTFDNAMVPPLALVADDDAIYWFGDFVSVTAPGQVTLFDASIRRTERRRAK